MPDLQTYCRQSRRASRHGKFQSCDSELWIDHFDVGIAEIVFVSVDKAVIPVTDRVAFDSVAGQKRDLHSVVIDVEMSLSF